MKAQQCSICKNNKKQTCLICLSKNDPNNPIQFLNNLEVFRCEYCNQNIPLTQVQSHNQNCDSRRITQQFYEQERIQRQVIEEQQQARQNQFFIEQQQRNQVQISNFFNGNNNIQFNITNINQRNHEVNEFNEITSLEQLRDLIRPNRFINDQQKLQQQQQNLIEIKFHLTKELTEDNQKCMICLIDYQEEEQLILLQCTHRFHSQCIKHWISKQPKCPLCRKNIEIL